MAGIALSLSPGVISHGFAFGDCGWSPDRPAGPSEPARFGERFQCRRNPLELRRMHPGDSTAAATTGLARLGHAGPRRPRVAEEGDAMKSKAIYGFHIVVGGLFVAAGSAKLAGVDIMVQEFDLVGLGQSFRILVGSLEIIGGLCLVVPRAGGRNFGLKVGMVGTVKFEARI